MLSFSITHGILNLLLDMWKFHVSKLYAAITVDMSFSQMIKNETWK